MKNTELLRLINDCVNGSISPPEHAALQERLKGDPQARAAFRERMDLEAALRTWASEGSTGVVGAEASSVGASEQGRGRLMWSRSVRVGLAIAASVIVVAGALLVWQNRGIDRQAGEAPPAVVANAGSFLGTIARQDSCVWAADANLPTGQRVTTGGLALVSGAAELKLDSGTDLILQGPCDLRIDSGSEAELLGGSVVVRVTELSDGFTLRTPDATILD